MDTGGLLKPGDLIFVRGHLKYLADDAIKLAETIETGMSFVKCYTHVAIYIGDGTVAEAQAGRKSGPAPLSCYEGNYDCGLVNLTDEQRQAVVDEAKRQYGRDYDWSLIGAIALKDVVGLDVKYHETNARICSTYVNDVFKKACYITLSDKEYPTPEDIALSKYVTLQHKSS
jgi:uncharacterized protein YycO